VQIDKYDFFVSVENGVNTSTKSDICYAVIGSITKDRVRETLTGVACDRIDSTDFIRGLELYTEAFEELKSLKLVEYSSQKYGKLMGYDTTVGELLQKADPSLDPKNWMETLCNYSRASQVWEALTDALRQLESKKLARDAYKIYEDFPIEGVVFQDIFPVFASNKATRALVTLMAEKYQGKEINYVVGLEARGFLLGILLAYHFEVGFIAARKPSKLPGKKFRREYKKEYGFDAFEMSAENLPPAGSKLLIVDDLIATGNSLQAVVDIVVKDYKCEVVGCCVLKQVEGLKEEAVKNLSVSYDVVLC